MFWFQLVIYNSFLPFFVIYADKCQVFVFGLLVGLKKRHFGLWETVTSILQTKGFIN